MAMTPVETVKAVKFTKEGFSQLLEQYGMIEVPAPLITSSGDGLNDDLAVKNSAIKFDAQTGKYEIVQSLAKYKRCALQFYDCEKIYTNMKAVRRMEDLDNLHSHTVDQWDWEMKMAKEDRTVPFLKTVVGDIYSMLYQLEDQVNKEYQFQKKLPKEIFFITSQDLEDMYPDKTLQERVDIIVKEKKAVFLMEIGHKLKSGIVQDLRAIDYDDWRLNGDIFVYSAAIDGTIELSSMGIRVSPESLLEQAKILGQEDNLSSKFHKKLLNNELPYSVGGGIGQSRVVMFMLEKKHIAEVQVSAMPDSYLEKMRSEGIQLLFNL